MAAGDVTNEKFCHMDGMAVWMGKVELKATETTTVDVDTHLTDILNVQLTGCAATLLPFVSSISGNTVTIDCENAVSGTNYAYMVAYGYNG